MPNLRRSVNPFLWYRDFCDFSRWLPPPSCFLKNGNVNDLPPVWGQSAPACQISSNSIKRLLRCGYLTVFFSKWRPSAILDFLGACWDNPRWLLGGLHRCAEFDLNRSSTFDNMNVLIFCAFGLKTPIHAPKIGVFGDLTPLVGSNINVTIKRH